MRLNGFSKAQVKKEGKPEAPAESVHNLIEGVHAHVEPGKANHKGERQGDKEPEEVPYTEFGFSCLINSRFLGMEYVEEYEGVHCCCKDGVPTWVPVLG